MAGQQPSLVTQTKLDNNAVKDVKVETTRTVKYILHIVTSDNLNLPYAVAIDGVAQDTYKTKPKRVSGNFGTITVSNVKPGSSVTLFLNSDAHPSHRKNPVYKVTPNDRDVTVTITEKEGKSSDADTPVQSIDKDSAKEKAKKADTYTAPLTGDIWMKVSHKYATSEVAALLPAGTSAEVQTAIESIYDVLKSASVSFTVEGKTVIVSFADSENPKDNINTGYTLLGEGLTRVHPAGYAALFNAAISAGVSKITMSSAWRPLLGSIAHRSGLGLDVNYVGSTRMNRQELRIKTGPDTTNVSEDEKTLLTKFEQSKKEQKTAAQKLAAASALAKKTKGDPAKAPEAIEAEKAAKEAVTKADEDRKSAEAAWNAERDKNEPDEVRQFRGSLMKCTCVSQLFDPWFMDLDNRDDDGHVPNMQVSKNEKLHAHHLHITVYDPKIL
jgi:hypothetical protein